VRRTLAIRDAIVSKNLDGVITSWNRGAERVFGYTAEEAVGQPITIVIPQDRQDEERTILTRIRRGERVDHFETIRQRKHGSLIVVSLTISPVRNAAGKIVGASKIARDITEQKRSQEQIVSRRLQTFTRYLSKRAGLAPNYQPSRRRSLPPISRRVTTGCA
jgi:PAS domain S-box-containing protein